MKKNKYISPEIEAVKLTVEDIINGSYVLIDGSELFGTESEG